MSDNLLLLSDEEVLGRQIRFSLPSDEKHEKTPEDILLLPAIRFV